MESTSYVPALREPLVRMCYGSQILSGGKLCSSTILQFYNFTMLILESRNSLPSSLITSAELQFRHCWQDLGYVRGCG
jgi:hypothetical protein